MEIEECLSLLLEAEHIELQTESVELQDSYGRISSADIYSPIMIPPFPKSAMDGYAVKSEIVMKATKEAPVRLKVIGELCAGDYAEYEPDNNTAVRIMTGAYVPANYDAVVRQEDTDYGEDYVNIYRGVGSYTNYCKIGEDLKQGQLVIKKGDRIDALRIGLLANMGISQVEVYRRLKVAVISTGSELCRVGDRLLPGKIYNNISHILSATMKHENIDVIYSDICEDETGVVADTINRLVKDEKADIIITTGAVSVGKKDIIPEVVEKIGANIIFRRANIQPGTPTMASVMNTGTILIHLSGNPYAALTNFEIYFWPLIAKIYGCEYYKPVIKEAIFKSEYPKINKMRRYIRAYTCDGEVRLPSNVHASSVISNMTECNCFIDLEKGRELKTGDKVKVVYFKGI